MGFSSSLQGQASHDAILTRIDAELRLLENMKRCLGLRVKADREYAISLNSFVLQAAKMDSVELAGSLVAKAWAVFIDETERMSRLIKESAETLATSTMEKLTSLYSEKKANRKQHQDEYSRICQELHRLKDQVHRTRNDYERCLDAYAVAKSKYEEQYTKGKMGKRLEDCRERYQKSCRKLHLTHNEYVLLLCEASEFERDMRTILLPGLLEHQQAVQEDMVDKWKLILQEVQKACNHAGQRCQEMQSKIESSVGAVKAGDEYAKFTEQNKTAPPSPVVFKFDQSLLKGFETLQLNPKAVTLDDLTIDTLKAKLQENETKLSECRSKIKEKQTLIIQYETELQTVKFKSDAVSVSRMFTVKKTMDFLKKEANELQCVEQKLTRQIEMIQVPINDLGCEQAPAGCDVSAASGAGDASSGDDGGGGGIASGHAKTTPPKLSFSSGVSNAMVGAQGAAQVMKALKKPFSASAISLTPSSQGGVPTAPGRKFTRHATTMATMSTTVVPSSLGSGSAPLAREDFESSTSSAENSNNNPAASTAADGAAGVAHSNNNMTTQLNDSLNSTGGLSDIDLEDAKSSMVFTPGRLLEEELWFHGVLPRGEVVRLLEVDGDFLVRETTRNEEKQIVLSVMWSSPKHFIVQTSPEGLFRFEGPAFGTVQELIIHQFQSGLPVTSRSGAVLKMPVVREKWELNNDDVELVDKIGRGNFGDVYRANLHLRKNKRVMSVAAKTCKVTLPEEHKKKFLQEGRILKQYDHPNIVRFIGICVQKQPIMIVMELVPGGSLLSFLRNTGAGLTSKNLLGMCLDAAAGMQYLESKNCIHRDLAARNCLVGEGNVVKISDFGMSREEEEYTVSDGLKQIPIKWTAPEALNYGKYTSLCDVWSFGVLCWEIFSRGGTPYQGMTNTKAREMLDGGYRMPAPENAPEEMYQLMLRCWQYEPEDRPHFNEIHNNIDLLYSRYAAATHHH